MQRILALRQDKSASLLFGPPLLCDRPYVRGKPYYRANPPAGRGGGGMSPNLPVGALGGNIGREGPLGPAGRSTGRERTDVTTPGRSGGGGLSVDTTARVGVGEGNAGNRITQGPMEETQRRQPQPPALRNNPASFSTPLLRSTATTAGTATNITPASTTTARITAVTAAVASAATERRTGNLSPTTINSVREQLTGKKKTNDRTSTSLITAGGGSNVVTVPENGTNSNAVQQSLSAPSASSFDNLLPSGAQRSSQETNTASERLRSGRTDGPIDDVFLPYRNGQVDRNVVSGRQSSAYQITSLIDNNILDPGATFVPQILDEDDDNVINSLSNVYQMESNEEDEEENREDEMESSRPSASGLSTKTRQNAPPAFTAAPTSQQPASKSGVANSKRSSSRTKDKVKVITGKGKGLSVNYKVY